MKRTESVPTQCFQHYNFRDGRHYPNVLSSDSLFGNTTITSVLNAEIRDYLVNPGLYEIHPMGYLPLRRFIRFFGVRNSSRETAILSFAATNNLDVFLVRSVIGFKPQMHLRKMYNAAKELQVPVLIVLKDVDLLFQQNAELGPQENYERTRNLLALTDELTSISEGGWPIWTVLATDHSRDLMFHLDKFFRPTTFWTGIPELRDLYDEVTRSRIFMHCLNKYIYDTGTGEFPFDRNPQLLLEFVISYATHCTFRQIDEFVRNVVCGWRQHVPRSEMSQLERTDQRLVPKTVAFIEAIRQSQTISTYPPFDGNVRPYVH